jgi:hypothetical protein
MRSSAPIPPTTSYHRSDMAYNASESAIPIHTQHHRNQFVETYVAEQRAQNTAMEDPQHSQYSPAATVLGTRSSHFEQPQPPRHPAAPTTAVHNVDHNTSTNRIRLSLVWDVTSINVWLDLDAPGETFFKNLQQQIEKRKPISDRAMMTIYLKKEKLMPDGEAYPLYLDKDELDADWETTVTWLNDNKREKPPHIIGRIQVGES